MNSNQKKFLQNKNVLIALLFLFPPLGIYGIFFKYNTALWKKIIYTISGILFFLFFIGLIGALTMDNYKEGLDYYNKQNYKKAFHYLNLVKPEDKNYNDAIAKIKEIKPIVDSLEVLEKQNDEKSSIQKSSEERKAVDSEQKTSTIGQNFSVGDVTYKIEKVKFKKFIGDIYTLNKADGKFLIITLTVTNNGNKTLTFDNSFFKLQDNLGGVYEYSPDGTASLEMSAFPGESFWGLTLNPRITKKAKLVFEVPSKNDYVLIFYDYLNNTQSFSIPISEN